MTEEKQAYAVISEMGHKKEIRGGFDYIVMAFENDYVMKAYGELMRDTSTNGQKEGKSSVYFLVYKSSMKKWQPPHEEAIVNKTVVDAIIKEVLTSTTEKEVEIRFA